MTERARELKVTSHIGRDLLSAASAFKTGAAVTWEYVVNSLQYTPRELAPKVQVDVDKKTKVITISDNGVGMSENDLGHFFKMHGENRERLSGRTGRGKFGTGKSAAFGIANSLKVDTRQGGLRNVVELTRAQVEKSTGESIPLTWVVINEPCDPESGTTVVISEVEVTLKTQNVVEYIEKQLQAFRARAPEVAVNNHLCVYKKPEIESEQTFHPSPEQVKVLGDVELIVQVARSPLSESDRGIAITAGPGNLIAVETAGVDKKDYGGYLFGHVDVPALEEKEGGIMPYDSSRSLKLNPQHKVVQVLIGFVGSKLEKIRHALVLRGKKHQESEQGRRLLAEASKIANILNDDFKRMADRLDKIRAVSGRSGPTAARFGRGLDGGSDPDSWIKGTQQPGDVVDRGTRRKKPPKPPPDDPLPPRPDPEIPVQGTPNPEGSSSVDPAGGQKETRRRPSGGFRVLYKPLGKTEERSRYDSLSLTIFINLDHPVVAAALNDGRVEDPTFRRLSYEIAFSEYAMGLGYELVKGDPQIPADDLLYEVRSTLNRVALAAAALYR